MIRRQNWLIGTLAFATVVMAQLTPSPAQNERCCSYRVRHTFRVCLPENCQPQVVWKWHTRAAAWQIGQTPVINTNSGVQTYAVPSTDTKCANAVFGQDCAFSTACARFEVNWIPGTPNCVQGYHETFGRACVRCGRHGANSRARSSIVIRCPRFTQGTIQWVPQFNDSVGGGCGVRITDPVVVRYRNPQTGETRNETLFELVAEGLNWETIDVDGDQWPEAARLALASTSVGELYVVKRTAGQVSTLSLRYNGGVVTESESTGEFAGIRLPNPGDPMPSSIDVPAVIDLPIEEISGYQVEEIEMGGGGESGEPVPVQGDVNGDGCVDDADLLQVLFAFGGQGGNADVNGDGIVDDADLLIVLFNFGTGC